MTRALASRCSSTSFANTRSLARLGAERLHRADAGHGLDEFDDHPRGCHPGAPEPRPAMRVWNQRVRNQSGTRAPARIAPLSRIDHDEGDRGADHVEHAGDEVADPGVEQLADGVEVARLPGDDPTGRVRLVELEAETLRLPEHPTAEVEEHRLADLAPAEACTSRSAGRRRCRARCTRWSRARPAWRHRRSGRARPGRCRARSGRVRRPGRPC